MPPVNAARRAEIVRLTNEGLGVKEIAHAVGCSINLVYKIQYKTDLRIPTPTPGRGRRGPRIRRHRKANDPDAVAGDTYRERAAMKAGVCIQHPDRKAVTTDGGIPLCAECDADTRLPGGAVEYCEWHGRQSVAKDVEETRR